MADTLSAKLGLEPPADLAHWIMPPKASQARRRIAEEEIATDRRVTADAFAAWLERLADAHEARGAIEHAQFTRADAAMVRQELLAASEEGRDG